MQRVFEPITESSGPKWSLSSRDLFPALNCNWLKGVPYSSVTGRFDALGVSNVSTFLSNVMLSQTPQLKEEIL